MIGAAANLLGWDIRGWFSDLWDTITEISIGVHHRRGRAEDRPDDADRICVVLDPPLRVSRPRALARHPRVLRGLRRAERHPAGEPRHARALLLMFTAIIAGATFAAILGGYAVEKIFFTRHRRVRLPVPLPERRRLVRHQVRVRERPPVGDRAPPPRRRVPDLPVRAPALAAGAPLVGGREGGRRDPCDPRASTWVASSCPRSSAGSRASA